MGPTTRVEEKGRVVGRRVGGDALLDVFAWKKRPGYSRRDGTRPGRLVEARSWVIREHGVVGALWKQAQSPLPVLLSAANSFRGAPKQGQRTYCSCADGARFLCFQLRLGVSQRKFDKNNLSSVLLAMAAAVRRQTRQKRSCRTMPDHAQAKRSAPTTSFPRSGLHDLRRSYFPQHVF